MSFSLLAANLQEIYAAGCDQNNVSVSLVPNYNGRSVYFINYFWQAFWLPFSEERKRERLLAALRHTQEIFERHLPAVVEKAHLFQEYIDKKSRGGIVDGGRAHQWRRLVKDWCFATLPFIQALHDESNKKLSSFCREFFSASLFFQCREEYNLLKSCLDVMELEDAFFSGLPLKIIAKLFRDQRLSNKDTKKLEEFIEELNADPDIVHDALMGLSDFFTDCVLTVGQVELKLYFLGMRKIFDRFGSRHLPYRSAIKENSEIICGGRKIIVGEEIDKKDSDADNSLVFAIANDRDRVLWFERNRAFHGLRQALAASDNWAVPFISFYEIEPKGRFAIVERLFDPLNKIAWRSSGDILADEDVPFLRPIANLIWWMIKQNRAPVDIRAKDIFFDQSGCLKTKKVVRAGIFSFVLLEDFIFEVAKNKLVLFQFLMQKSGLRDHPHRMFFGEIVCAVTRHEDIDIQKLCERYDVYDDLSIDRGEQLIRKVKKYRGELIGNFNFTEKAANEAILKRHKESFAGSRLWKDNSPHYNR